MKKFVVAGNPIEHSLSPRLHNFWFKENNIKAEYNKKVLEKRDLPGLVDKMRSQEINGVNVTVPFKKDIINFLDELSAESKQTDSVNTLVNENGKIIGHNTDIAGFELAIRHINYDLKNKNILILGAGGVVPSIIFALRKSNINKISIMNRSIHNAKLLKEKFKHIDVLEWGSDDSFDVIINATSVGLKNNDKIDLNIKKFGEKKFFYDVIYNPKETQFLKDAKDEKHTIENGRMMFIYQAHQAFTLWHKIMPKINQETIKLLDI